MGQFILEDKTHPVNFIRIKGNWKLNTATFPTFIALVENAQLATPDGRTLTFKQGAIISLITDLGLCVYRDDDLV